MKKEENNVKNQVLTVLREIRDVKQWNKTQDIKEDLERRAEHRKTLEEQREHENKIREEKRELIDKTFTELNYYEDVFGKELKCKCGQKLPPPRFFTVPNSIPNPQGYIGAYTFCTRCPVYFKYPENEKFAYKKYTFALPKENTDISDLDEVILNKYWGNCADKTKRAKLINKYPIKKLFV